ncbi:GFA family protein [Cupriavidus basilensis]|uniref:GFA family protein n=1 Tax=Cupriavidus basilensis TaxID=68895 RepID=A0ABT6AIU4_9BURK|nr:GFA family protein [Cupriavidus basilensis]MDF3832523.1 GFA family protein [Cupriavidus basilensis]
MPIPSTLTCLCGQVQLRIAGEPVARANCHCQACRDFYGTPVFAATAWEPAHVAVERGDDQLATYQHATRQLQRHFCRQCGETLFGTNRLGMSVVPNSLFARASDGVLPDALQPAMHLFYRHRVVDVADALPKYLDGWDGPLHKAGF